MYGSILGPPLAVVIPVEVIVASYPRLRVGRTALSTQRRRVEASVGYLLLTYCMELFASSFQ